MTSPAGGQPCRPEIDDASHYAAEALVALVAPPCSNANTIWLVGTTSRESTLGAWEDVLRKEKDVSARDCKRLQKAAKDCKSHRKGHKYCKYAQTVACASTPQIARETWNHWLYHSLLGKLPNYTTTQRPYRSSTVACVHAPEVARVRASRTSIIQCDKGGGPGAAAAGSWDEEMDRESAMHHWLDLDRPQHLRV